MVEQAADVESRGTATVYRFGADSVRRALDAGTTADECTLEEASPNGVPQPLSYLVRDVARRHGLVRVGRASSFLRPRTRPPWRSCWWTGGSRRWACDGSPRPCWPPRPKDRSCSTRSAGSAWPRPPRAPTGRCC